jgi:RES domain-containing protein
MLEQIVHFADAEGRIPRVFDLLQVDVRDGLAIEDLSAPEEADWKRLPGTTRRIGNEWLAAKSSAIARVPSAIAPLTWNLLMNPAHPDAIHCSISQVFRERFDKRFFQSRGL